MEGEIDSCCSGTSKISRLLLLAHGVVRVSEGASATFGGFVINELVGMQVVTTVTVVGTVTVVEYE